MTNKTFYTEPYIPAQTDAPAHKTPELRDYFCPFCGHRLFRGNVKDFKLVCMECNKLVDSTKIEKSAMQKSAGDSE